MTHSSQATQIYPRSLGEINGELAKKALRAGCDPPNVPGRAVQPASFTRSLPHLRSFLTGKIARGRELTLAAAVVHLRRNREHIGVSLYPPRAGMAFARNSGSP